MNIKRLLIALPVLAAGFIATQGLAAEDKIPLKVDMPKPLFIGTKKPIKIENLEPVETKQAPIMVPKGLTNLASGKEVTGSDDFPVIGELEYITDGDKDGSDGYFVELGPGVQWVQIDLGAPSQVYAVVVWHYHQQARAYHDVVVQLADDPDFTKNVRAVYNADHDNSAGLGVGKHKNYVETNRGRVIDAGGQTARYLRLYSNGNTSDGMNHYIEVEVFGKAKG